MKKMFFANSGAVLKDTLFPDFYPGVQANLRWSKLDSQQDGAVRSYLLPFLGQAFWDDLSDRLQASPAEESTTEEAGLLVRRCLAYFMIFDTIPTMLGNLSALGFQTMSDQNGTSNGPAQWEYKATRWHAMSQGDVFLDHLLRFLDDNVDDFPFYRDDPARQYRKSVTFQRLEDLDRYLNIQGSRRAYNRIVPYFEEAEHRHLTPLFGEDFLEEVRTMVATDPAARTQVQAKLVRCCQTYVSKVGLSEALPHLSCVIQGDGIVVVSRMDGFDQRNGSGLVYNQAALSRLRQQAMERAKESLQDLRSCLLSNIESFPTWAAYYNSLPQVEDNSGVYGTPDSGAVGIF